MCYIFVKETHDKKRLEYLFSKSNVFFIGIIKNCKLIKKNEAVELHDLNRKIG